jgi:2-keto-4-pentenoate hydratase/2-oxohepta-3-ene-1,7-dioic acid hydratase in catechol pathway
VTDLARLINFRTVRDAEWRAGVELDGHVADLRSLPGCRDIELTVDSLVGSGPMAIREAIEKARIASDAGRIGMLPVDDLQIGPPILRPSKIICIGFNYRAHADEFEIEAPTHPTLFAKFANSLVGPYAPVHLPAVSQQVDYEGELAVVIGERCKDVPPERALGVIAGLTIFNDVTARDLQFLTSQFTTGKTLDTFAPMGPGLVSIDQVPDPQALRIRTYLNGDQMQDGGTDLMIFTVPELVARISALMTLCPGDVIATGTPSGVGYKRTPPVFLKAGDLVEVEIQGLGRIANPIIDGIGISADEGL